MDELLKLGIDTSQAKQSLQELNQLVGKLDKSFDNVSAGKLLDEYKRIKGGVTDLERALAQLESRKGASASSVRRYSQELSALLTQLAQQKAALGGVAKMLTQVSANTKQNTAAEKEAAKAAEASAQRTAYLHKVQLQTAKMTAQHNMKVRADYISWWEKTLAQEFSSAVTSLKQQEAAEQKSAQERLATATRVIKARQEGERAYTAWWDTELKKRDALEASRAMASATLRSKLTKISSERLDRGLIAPASGTSELSRYYESVGAVRGGGNTLAKIMAADAAAQAAALREATAAKLVAASATGELEKSTARLSRTTKDHTAATHGWTKAQINAHSAARGLAGAMGQLWMTYGSTPQLVFGAAIGGSLVMATKAGAEFEYQMAFVKAITEETDAVMASLSATALDLARNSMFGPVEAANGLRILGQAGLEAHEAIAALPHVFDLATAGEMKMEDAAITLVGVMNAFGMEVDQIQHVGDVLANAAIASQVSVMDMTEAMKYASVAGEQYGASLEDTATALTVLGEINIRGTAAGTSFRNMLKELYTPGKDAAEMLKMLGVATSDASGNLRAFPNIIYDLRDELSQFDKISQTNILQKLFGERGAKEAIAMLAKTREKWGELRKEVGDGVGSMRRIAEELEKTTKGSMLQAVNTLRATMIEAFQSTDGAVAELAVKLKELFGSEALMKTVSGLLNAVIGVADVFVTLAKALEPVASLLSNLVQPLVYGAAAWGAYRVAAMAITGTLSVLSGGLGALASALAALKLTQATLAIQSFAAAAAGTASGVGGLAKLITLLRTFAGPVGLATTLLGGLYYGFQRLNGMSSSGFVASSNAFTESLESTTRKLQENNDELREQLRLRSIAVRGEAPDIEARIAETEAQINKKRSWANSEERRLSSEEGGSLLMRGVNFFEHNAVSGARAEADALEANLVRDRAALAEAKRQVAESDRLRGELKKLDEEEQNKLGTGTRNIFAESYIKGANEIGDPVNSARLDALNGYVEAWAKSNGDLKVQADLYDALQVRLAKIDEDASKGQPRVPSEHKDYMSETLRNMNTAMDSYESGYKQFVTEIETATRSGRINVMDGLDMMAEASTEAFMKSAAAGNAARSELEKTAKKDGELAAALAKVDDGIIDARNKNLEELEDIEKKRTAAFMDASDAVRDYVVDVNASQLGEMDAFALQWANKWGDVIATLHSVVVKGGPKAEEARAIIEKLIDARAVEEGVLKIKSALGILEAELSLHMSALDDMMERDEKGGIFSLLGGSARDISRQTEVVRKKLEAQLQEVERALASANQDPKYRLEWLGQKDDIERKLRRLSEESISPTLARWGDDLGTYIADAIVYGFEEGESPAKAFANMLKRELAQALSNELGGFFKGMLNSLFGGASNGAGGALGTLFRVGVSSLLGGGGGGGGSGVGGMLNGASSANSAYQMFTQGIGSYYGGYVSGFGNLVGSTSIAGYGTGMAMNGSQAAYASAQYVIAAQEAAAAGNTAAAAQYMQAANGLEAGAGFGGQLGAAGTFAAYALGGYGLGKILSDGRSISGKSGNQAVLGGMAVGTAIAPGIGTLIGGAIGGLVNGLFGKKDKPRATYQMAIDPSSVQWEDQHKGLKNVTAEGAFGTIGMHTYTKDIDARDYRKQFESMALMDDLLASRLEKGEVTSVRARMDGWTSSHENRKYPDRALSERLLTIAEGVGGDFYDDIKAYDESQRAINLAKNTSRNNNLTPVQMDNGTWVNVPLTEAELRKTTRGASPEQLYRYMLNRAGVDDMQRQFKRLGLTIDKDSAMTWMEERTRTEKVTDADGKTSDVEIDGYSELMGNAAQMQAMLFPDRNAAWRDTQRGIVEMFEGINQKAPRSVDEFRNMVKGLDLTTDAGRDMYLELSKIAPAFMEVAGAVQAMIDQIKQSTADTIESFRMDVMTDQEKYAYYDQRIDANLAKMAETDDPQEILNLYNQSNSDLRSSWALLTPEEKKRLLPEFEDRATRLEEQSTGRINLTPQEEAQAQGEAIGAAVKSAITETLTEIGNNLASAGTDQAASAAALRAAIESLPDRIVIATGGSEVGVGLG